MNVQINRNGSDPKFSAKLAEKIRILRSSASRRGKEYALSEETVGKIMKIRKCVYTHRDFTKKGDFILTFERINPRHGYVHGNVIAVTNEANSVKGDRSIEDLLADGNMEDKNLAALLVAIETARASLVQIQNGHHLTAAQTKKIATQALGNLQSAGKQSHDAFVTFRRAKTALQIAHSSMFTDLHALAWEPVKEKPLRERLRGRFIRFVLLLRNNRFFKRHLGADSNEV